MYTACMEKAGIDNDTYYETWLNECERSVRCVAERYGVTTQNIYELKKKHQWDARVYRETLPKEAQNLKLAKFFISEGLVGGARHMIEIMNNGENDKDRVNAFRALTEAYKALNIVEPVSAPSGVLEASFVSLSETETTPIAMDDARGIAGRMLEEQINQHNTRKR